MPSRSGKSASFAPVRPEPKPEERPHFFAGASRRREPTYAEGVGRKASRCPGALKDEGDKLLAAGVMLEDALRLYTAAIDSLREATRAGEGQKPPRAWDFPFDKTYTIHHSRAVCLNELRRYPEAVEDAEAVIAARPGWVNGYLRKADALFGMARFEEARAACDAGMEAKAENKYDADLRVRGVNRERSDLRRGVSLARPPVTFDGRSRRRSRKDASELRRRGVRCRAARRVDPYSKARKQACVDVMMRALVEGPHPSRGGAPGYPRGAPVTVKGLKSKPELNGSAAEVVLDPLRGGGTCPTVRIRVRLRDGRELAVKGENLEPRAGSDTVSDAVGSPTGERDRGRGGVDGGQDARDGSAKRRKMA